MAAHQYWRLTGFLTDSSALELSQAQLYDGTQLIAQAPTFTVPPTTGAAFPDVLRWDDFSMPGFALVWDLATPVDSPSLRLGAGPSAVTFPKELYCQYSDDGKFWSTNNFPVNIKFPGSGLLTDEPGSVIFDPAPTQVFTGVRKGFIYDPSDMSTLFQDIAGTIPVTAVGQPVRKILDKSGRSAHGYARTTATPTLGREADGRYYIDTTNGSGLSTNAIDFTYTDKMTLCMGARMTDSGAGIMVELSSDLSPNIGAFYLVHSEAAIGDLSLGNHGDALLPISAQSAPFAMPHLSVVTARYDIAGTSKAQEIRLRRNTEDTPLVTAGSIDTDSGNGGYGNYPVYIGSRNDTGVFSKVRIYALVLLGDEVTAAELASLEYFVNKKTEAYPQGDDPNPDRKFIPLSNSPAEKRWRTTSLPFECIVGTPLPDFNILEFTPQTSFMDAYHGGRGIIRATVKRKNTPENTPLRRKVLLIDEASNLVIRKMWSDSVTGAYEFLGIREGRKYTVLSYDYTNTYRAVIANGQIPESML